VGCTNTELLWAAQIQNYCGLHKYRIIVGFTNTELLWAAQIQNYCGLHKYRIIVGCTNTDSYGDLFQKLKSLPLQSQYIISPLLTVVNNKLQQKVNLEIYSMSTKKSPAFISLH